jgi:hypothetical protein
MWGPLDAETGTIYTGKRRKIEKKEDKATGAEVMAGT